MKRGMSVRLKITLWFSGALIVIAALACAIILAASGQVIRKSIRDSLIETVENNVDEIEYFESLDEAALSGDVDHFIEYEGGYLEIDDDFLDSVNGVYTALYNKDGTLLYGENPAAGESGNLDFVDMEIQNLSDSGVNYYVFDRQLEDELTDLWLRGVVSEDQSSAQMQGIYSITLIAIPLLLVLSIIGGYVIAGRALRPVKQVSAMAEQISGGDDLDNRLDIGTGNREFKGLADSFNEMLKRLKTAFEKEKQFTSDASHELRTPVSVILAQCEYALEGPKELREYEDAIKTVQRQGRKMSHLIDDMLVFARLDDISGMYKLYKTDISELVRSLCADMALLRYNDIELICDAEDDVTANANPEILTRLLGNLIDNSYKYGRKDGHIRVSLAKADGNINLSVADDGMGISDDDLEKIFDRFYQADSSHSGVGAGLGLSMAKEIALFHGGTLSAESKLGKGSRFIFTMPSMSS